MYIPTGVRTIEVIASQTIDHGVISGLQGILVTVFGVYVIDVCKCVNQPIYVCKYGL